MPECIDCRHCDMKTEKAQARLGFGHCAFEPMAARFNNVKWPRDCNKFEALPAEKSEARRNWLKGRN